MADSKLAPSDATTHATVLVVDDSISVRKALERILAPRGFTVLAAESAAKALTMIDEHNPDLVIADVVMPETDGFELAKQLKNDPARRRPVLLISGIVGPDVVTKAKAAGALGVVEKPFTADELVPRLKAALAPPETPDKVSEAKPPQPQPHTGPGEVATLLEPFLARQDIDGAVLISTKGKIVFQLGELTNPNQVGAQIAALAALSRRLGGAIEQKTARSIALEYADKTLLLYRIASNLYLVLVLTDLGAVSVARYLVKQQVPKLIAFLKAQSGR